MAVAEARLLATYKTVTTPNVVFSRCPMSTRALDLFVVLPIACQSLIRAYFADSAVIAFASSHLTFCLETPVPLAPELGDSMHEIRASIRRLQAPRVLAYFL